MDVCSAVQVGNHPVDIEQFVEGVISNNVMGQQHPAPGGRFMCGELVAGWPGGHHTAVPGNGS